MPHCRVWAPLMEKLQYELGEGPCIDACHLDRPVLEPDLASPATPRWLAFTTPALRAGAAAVTDLASDVIGGAVAVADLDPPRLPKLA